MSPSLLYESQAKLLCVLMLLACVLTCTPPRSQDATAPTEPPTSSLRRDTFTVEAWRAARRLGRYWLAEDYLRTRDVYAMSLADVIADLGTPDSAEDWSSYALCNTAAESLGPEGHGSEAELIVRFGLDQRVTSLICYPHGLRAEREFDAARWRIVAPTERLPMAKDLAVSGQCIALTEAQLTEILGPPDRRCPNPWIKYTVANSLADYEFLEFRGDETGRIVWASLYDG